MLKVLFVLGCLLSLTLAQPIDTAPERVARSNSNEIDTAPERVARSNSNEGFNLLTRQLLIQMLFNILQSQQTATTAAATTQTATTAAATTAAATTAAAGR
ncbi:hypothetical protein PAMP_021106 [Pampus punctatissimus]